MLPTRRRALALTAGFAAASALPASAQALPPKAQESFDAAFRLNLQGRIGDAIVKYEEALALAPKSKEVMLEYVVALRRASRFQRSVKAGWQLLEIDGSNPAAWTNLGNTFLAALVDASTGQPFGTVQIPFYVK